MIRALQVLIRITRNCLSTLTSHNLDALTKFSLVGGEVSTGECNRGYEKTLVSGGGGGWGARRRDDRAGGD